LAINNFAFSFRPLGFAFSFLPSAFAFSFRPFVAPEERHYYSSGAYSPDGATYLLKGRAIQQSF